MMNHSMSCEYPEGCSCGASEWNRMAQRLDELERENARLRRGEFTPAELQEICHNLSPNPDKREAFFEGCANYQRQVFGCAHVDQLSTERDAWERRAKAVSVGNESLTIENAKLRAELDRYAADGTGIVDRLLNHCQICECSECSEIVCPHGDPLHLHHDGCPSCSTEDTET